MKQITADWLLRPETRAVADMLTKSGAQALYVGGCVRNTLLSAPVTDIDIATDASTTEVMRIANGAGLKAIPTGLEHGTITVVSNGVPHEVTTFRKDVQTDGRHAVVAFSTNLVEDAARRDFTMNALYATPDGELVDPLDGLEDLRVRRVRFIGDAQDRIREDYLRSLRFFRFHAWYGDPSLGMDAEALAAIAKNLDGLHLVSKERVGMEMLKLLSAPDPAPAVASMRQAGILQLLLPGADDRALAPLIHLSESRDPMLRLAALGRGFEAALRLKKTDARRVEGLRSAAEGGTPAELGYRMGAPDALEAMALRAALMEQPLKPEDVAAVSAASKQAFPIKAADLMPRFTGAALGDVLRQLEAAWIASEFGLSRDDLLTLAYRDKEG